MFPTTTQEHRVLTDAGLQRADRRKKRSGWIGIAAGILMLLASGCIRIPEESWTVSQRTAFETRRQTAECTAAGIAPSFPDSRGPGPATPARTVQPPALNADGFSMVSWNIFKGKKQGWAEDFKRFSRNTDILILQEAYLTDSLKQMLQVEQYQWDMTAAFEYRAIEAGVLTAARTAPNFTCSFRETEPITRIPKSTLISRYPLSGTEQELLVANMHAINFSMQPAAFQKQFDRLEGLLAAVQGPLIVSGDFNTWTSGRMAQVKAMANRLGLTAVGFDENRRSRFFGRHVDHVYYRGLEAKNAAIPVVSTSDHNPLLVVFKLANDPAAGR